MKIRLVGAYLVNANGKTETVRTDRHMTKVTVAFHNFANAPEKMNTHFIYVALYIYTCIKQGDYVCTEIPIGR